MRSLPVPAIVALVLASSAANAVEGIPARKKLETSPAAMLTEKPEDLRINVGGIDVLPAGNLGSANGKLKFHLKGLIAGAYDSNLYATESFMKDDEYLRVLAGFDAVYRVNDRLGIGAEVIADNQVFAEYSDRNLFGGQARVRSAYKGETLAGNLTLDYILIDDPLVQTGERIKRSAFGANTLWLREMLGGGILVNADAHRSQYLEDQGGFVAEDRNVNSYIAGVRYIREKSERSSYWARVGYAADNYDTDKRLQDVTAISGAIGADIGLGDRATLFAEAGVDSRSYAKDFAVGYDDKDVLAPVASLGLHYPINEKGSLATARVYTEARNSLRSNAMQVTGVTLDGRHPLNEKITAVASASGLLLTDYGSAKGTSASERQSLGGSLGAEYTLRNGVVLRATGRYTKSEAKLAAEADYDRFEGVLETAFAF